MTIAGLVILNLANPSVNLASGIFLATPFLVDAVIGIEMRPSSQIDKTTVKNEFLSSETQYESI